MLCRVRNLDGSPGKPTLTFRFSYLPLWQEIMSIISRDGRGAAVCSDHLLSELLTATVSLLHGARQYIRTDGERILSVDSAEFGSLPLQPREHSGIKLSCLYLHILCAFVLCFSRSPRGS
jgi:hypothetical protein